jgi:hypothetical protein
MNRSTPDAAVTFDPTHNTYATLGELHLDRERDLHLVRDVRCGGRGAGAPRSRRSRAPATWNDGVDGALLCGLLFSLHDDQVNQAHGVLQVLARGCVTYRLHSGIRGRVSSCVGHGLLDCRCQHLLASVTLRSKIIRYFSSS